MSVSLFETVEVFDDVFTVMTKTNFMLLASKPRSHIMPVVLNGQKTLAPGIQIFYATSDTKILCEWHAMLCKGLRTGGSAFYDNTIMYFRNGQVLVDGGQDYLAQYVKGFNI